MIIDNVSTIFFLNRIEDHDKKKEIKSYMIKINKYDLIITNL